MPFYYGCSTYILIKSMKNQHDLAIALDIGGTKIASGIISPDCSVDHYSVKPTPIKGGKQSLFLVDKIIGDLISKIPKSKNFVISISVPEIVDYFGNIDSNYSIDWTSEDLYNLYPKEKVVIDADVHVAAQAEYFAAGKSPASHFLYISIGTGISCSYLVDGAPLRGKNGFTGIIGTGKFAVFDVIHDKLFENSIEAFASGYGIKKIANLHGLDILEARELFEIYNIDACAKKILDNSSKSIGTTLGVLINLLDPDKIVVGGGMINAPDFFWEDIVKNARLNTVIPNSSEIKKSFFNQDSGLIGAGLNSWIKSN